jgi:hypothetical protein
LGEWGHEERASLLPKPPEVSTVGDLIKEALSIGWPLLALVAGLFVYSLVTISDRVAKKRAMFKLFIGMIAACMLLVAMAH